MKVIRKGVFETNNSSTHSLTFCSGAEFKEWEDGKVRFTDEEGFISLEKWRKNLIDLCDNNDVKAEEYPDTNELRDELQEAGCDDYSLREAGMTHEEWEEGVCDRGTETYERQHTTPSGDIVIAFGEYGGHS